jgi:hypothetical protein
VAAHRMRRSHARRTRSRVAARLGRRLERLPQPATTGIPAWAFFTASSGYS